MEEFTSLWLDKLLSLIESRRFLTAFGAVLIVVFQDVAGLDEQQATTLVGILATWIVGDSIKKTDRK